MFQRELDEAYFWLKMLGPDCPPFRKRLRELHFEYIVRSNILAPNLPGYLSDVKRLLDYVAPLGVLNTLPDRYNKRLTPDEQWRIREHHRFLPDKPTDVACQILPALKLPDALLERKKLKALKRKEKRRKRKKGKQKKRRIHLIYTPMGGQPKWKRKR